MTAGSEDRDTITQIWDLNVLWIKGPGKDIPDGTYGEQMKAILDAHTQAAVAGLRAALEGLLDEQNGVPLFTREKEYLAAVEAARTALRPAHTQTKST